MKIEKLENIDKKITKIGDILIPICVLTVTFNFLRVVNVQSKDKIRMEHMIEKLVAKIGNK